MIDQSLISLLNFGMSVAIGRSLGSTALADYVLIFSALTVGVAVAESLIAAPMTILVTQIDPAARSSYAGFILTAHCLFAVLVSGVTVAMTWSVLSDSGPILPLVGAAWIASVLSRELGRRVSMATHRPMLAIALDLSIVVLQTGLTILALLSHWGLSAVMAMAGAAHVASLLIWLHLAQPQVVLRSAHWGNYAASHTKAGIPNLGALGTFIIQLYAPVWLLTFFGTTSNVGIFAACHALVMLSNPLTQGLANAMMPTAATLGAAREPAAYNAFLSRSRLVLLAINLPITLALVLGGGWALGAVYGPAFIGQGVVISILATAALVRSLAMASYISLWAQGRSNLNAVSNCAGLGVSTAVILIAGAEFGLVGVAIGVMTGDCISALLREWLLQRNMVEARS